jgi:hypothetical protein
VAEMRRSAARATIDLTAYDLYLRAVGAFFPTTKERILASLALLEQAIAIDRHYGPALSWAAICHLRLVVDGFVEAPETSRRKAIDLLGCRSGRKKTILASSPTPPSCSPILARMSAP